MAKITCYYEVDFNIVKPIWVCYIAKLIDDLLGTRILLNYCVEYEFTIVDREENSE